MAEDPMQQLSDWARTLSEALGLAGSVDDRTIELVLSLASVSAHGVIRPAAPVTTFLAGLAVAGRPDMDLEEVKRRVDALLAS
jgi:hypothetical protein